MDFVAEEFVASGYNFRHLVRMIVSSEVYARANAPADSDYGTTARIGDRVSRYSYATQRMAKGCSTTAS